MTVLIFEEFLVNSPVIFMKDGGAEVAPNAELAVDADDEELDDDAIAMEQAADEIEQEVLSEQECVSP